MTTTLACFRYHRLSRFGRSQGLKPLQRVSLNSGGKSRTLFTAVHQHNSKMQRDKIYIKGYYFLQE